MHGSYKVQGLFLSSAEDDKCGMQQWSQDCLASKRGVINTTWWSLLWRIIIATTTDALTNYSRL